ncbi:FkbM family methyltransferase [Kaistella sp. 97-N-M2]|uniref:FkbM family methyltransferase n=1 Tax=Kaistella sp. 97-N-M2 TaxID=2908645 RepID=UPI001F01F24E|nr:FkbM family methyltransferase [Kaistella sp. 97-N-M2]UJF30653.1 FkbM family methyltransferase [Kaistella sp. 97-N-M2]
MNVFKKIYRLNKKAYTEYKNRDVPHPKTGISESERKRLLKYPPFMEGEGHFFGQRFRFSHGPSFVHSVDELFDEEVYKFESDKENPYIVDCGANIGLSILYFKKRFPKSKILAFEPDDQIFDILKKNILVYNNFSDVVLKKEAVWIEDTELSFFSEGALAGSSVVDFGNNNNVIKVQAVDLKKHLQKPVDFLKIDIEGAENKVIFDIAVHLDNVKNLFLEYHGLLNEPQNLGEILNLLKQKGFEYYIRVADDTLKFPFCNESPSTFNQQLNIFCYRK